MSLWSWLTGESDSDLKIRQGEMATSALRTAAESGYDPAEFDRNMEKAQRLAKQLHPDYTFPWETKR